MPGDDVECTRHSVSFIIGVTATAITIFLTIATVIHDVNSEWADVKYVLTDTAILGALGAVLVAPVWFFWILGSSMISLEHRQPAIWAAQLVCIALALEETYAISKSTSSTAVIGFIWLPFIEGIAGLIVLFIGVLIGIVIRFVMRHTRSGKAVKHDK